MSKEQLPTLALGLLCGAALMMLAMRGEKLVQASRGGNERAEAFDSTGINEAVARVSLRAKRGGNKKAALVLTGCGYLDGTETTEAIACLCSLSEEGIQVVVFAPSRNQADVVDHASCKALGFAPRQMIQEAARLSRGNVKPLEDLNAEEFDALIVPGGFGAAKNLCNWASATSPQECVLDSEMKRVLDEFAAQKKPMGLCCIAPVLAAVNFPGVKLTLGKAEPFAQWPYGGTVAGVKSLGARQVDCNVDEIVVDEDLRIVTTPAYMFDGPRHEIFFGVRRMIQQVATML